MTDMTWGPADVAPFETRRPQRRSISQGAMCALALLFSAPLGLGILYLRPADTAPQPVAALAAPVVHPTAPPAALAPLRHYAALLDPSFLSGTAAESFVKPTALRSAFEPRASLPPEPVPAAALASADRDATPAQVASAEVDEQAVVPSLPAPPTLVEEEIPLPAPRPDFAAAPQPSRSMSGRRMASAATEDMPEDTTRVAPVAPGAPAATAAPADHSSFFDKLFRPLLTPNSALGYANPETGEIGTPGGVDRYTAVYDISAHTVTLPDGRRLEAHSGLGSSVDDPSSVAQRMRGATPPNLYELKPREALFHGVRALRMTPTGGTTYGRAGLLTHSYMLRGRSGESNGCVVFRNYDEFIAAYDSGQVRRLLVVAHAS